MGALLRVQVPPRAGHSEQSEAQLREGDRAWEESVERKSRADVAAYTAPGRTASIGMRVDFDESLKDGLRGYRTCGAVSTAGGWPQRPQMPCISTVAVLMRKVWSFDQPLRRRSIAWSENSSTWPH